MPTRTPPTACTADSTSKFSFFESRAWKRPSQLRIRNPNRIPAPICTRIRFPAIAEGTSAPPASTCRGNPCGCPPTRTRPSTPARRSCGGRSLRPIRPFPHPCRGTLRHAHPPRPLHTWSVVRSLSNHHPEAHPEAKGEPGGGGRQDLPYRGFVSQPPSSALFPICDSPRLVLHSPPRGLSPICDPTAQPRDCRTTPKLDLLSEAHSIDAIPTCAHFTAYRFPNLHRDVPGTARQKKHATQFNSKQIAAVPVVSLLAAHSSILSRDRRRPCSTRSGRTLPCPTAR